MRDKATRGSRTIGEMPDQAARLEFSRVFSDEEYQQISLGLTPQMMEDKWFIFEENQQVFFHRSWTGFLIYKMSLSKVAVGYEVLETWVNRDPDQYRAIDDGHDIALLGFLIDRFLLGKATTFPVPPNLPDNLPKGLYQHAVSGIGAPERTSDTEKHKGTNEDSPQEK